MRMKRFLVFAITFILMVTGVACEGRTPPGTDDPADMEGKTILKVANYNGGYGSQWLSAVKKRFEDEYKDVQFESDKTGVFIEVETAKSNGVSLLGTNVTASDTHIFFNEVIDYDQFVAQGYALDLTESLKAKLPNEEKSILDKFSPDQRTYLERSGKYYMVPHYAGFNGITIDENLFNEKKLFMDTNGNFTKTVNDTGRSKGPDNKENTYDDGLPATLDDFYKMMATMNQRSLTPFVWTADNQFYVTRMAEAYAADVNGATNTKIGYAFNDTLENLVKSVRADGSIEHESQDITHANGYEVIRQDGYYYSLEFVEKIVDGGYFNQEYCFDGGTHLESQKRFLQSNSDMAAAAGAKPIAMMIEGCWWEGEASPTFTAMEQLNTDDKKYGKMDRNFRFIPFPKATSDKVGEPITLLETLRSYSFVNANIKDNEAIKTLATLFLQYCNTDVSLKEFTAITSGVKALEYEMDKDSLENCTTLCKSILDMKNAEGTTIVYPLSDSTLFKATVGTHTLGVRYLSTKGGDPTSVFRNDKAYTALEYFNGMSSLLKRDWASKYGQYIK